jgi:hypothetical protein
MGSFSDQHPIWDDPDCLIFRWVETSNHLFNLFIYIIYIYIILYSYYIMYHNIYILYVYVPSFFFYVGSLKQWPTSSINSPQKSDGCSIWTAWSWSKSRKQISRTWHRELVIVLGPRWSNNRWMLAVPRPPAIREIWHQPWNMGWHSRSFSVLSGCQYWWFWLLCSVQREFETSWVRLFWFQAVTWMLALDSSLSCTRDSLSTKQTWGFFVDMAEMIVTIFLNASSCPLDRRHRPETSWNST